MHTQMIPRDFLWQAGLVVVLDVTRVISFITVMVLFVAFHHSLYLSLFCPEGMFSYGPNECAQRNDTKVRIPSKHQVDYPFFFLMYFPVVAGFLYVRYASRKLVAELEAEWKVTRI